MLKMETIQIHQKAKTLFHYISKKLFNNFFYRFISLIFLFLLITTKISEYVLQNNNKRYINNGEIKTINMNKYSGFIS